MKTFSIIKKNRKYFDAELNGYKCKLIIDKNSEHLAPGEHTLDVEDLSVRTKYGTDLKFKVRAEVKEICSLHAPYNSNLVKKCKRLGGIWTDGAWVFSKVVEAEVEDLDFIYNSEPVTIEIWPVDQEDGVSAHTDSVQFCGYTICSAEGRDSGADIERQVALLSGQIRSGGSMKNWRTVVSGDAKFRLEVPAEVLKEFLSTDDETQGIADEFHFKIISE